MPERTVNGHKLHEYTAHTFTSPNGEVYMITQPDGERGVHVVSHVTAKSNGQMLLTVVDMWHALPDAVQGAVAHSTQHLADTLVIPRLH